MMDHDRSHLDSDTEDFQEGINGVIFSDLREGFSGSPLYPCEVTYPSELMKGDHIIFQTADFVSPFRPSYQSALVLEAEKDWIQIMAYTRKGISEENVAFSSFKHLHKVEYLRCKFSAKNAVWRAKWRQKSGENHYHTLFNNSHFFVSWAKTGKEYPLNSIIDHLSIREDEVYPLNPVFSRAHVTSSSDINPGDHLMLGSTHYLVESIDTESDTFTAFTIKKGSIVREEKRMDQCNTGLLRVDYDQQSNTYHPGKALEKVAKELEEKSKWEGSDCFVSMMKCGRKHTITEKCFFNGDLEPVSCTAVTPHIAVDVGDHLLVRGTFGDFHSVLVYSCINAHTIVSIPCLHKKERMGRLNLIDYNEIYRVNYHQSLPIDEILRRVGSPEGEQILSEGRGDASGFVSWVKVGREISINVPKLIKKQQIALIRPSEYEKVLSADEIKVGDHLFIPNPAYRWHFLVTEKIACDAQGPLLLKAAYCIRGSVKETEEKIDPTQDDVFKVLYPEEYTPSLAIKRARSLLTKVHLSPVARMWFVRWAKTGSEEGLEIDFLKRKSMPVSKSRILSFTQLNPGDYLVQDKGKFSPRHHYLVISVESAQVCTVIGTWNAKVQQSQLALDNSTFHKVLYEEGVCIPASESIHRAQEAVRAQFNLKFMRRKFVNFMKTTDAVDVDIEHLPDDRILLQRERVNSAEDLMPGDHFEIPTKSFQKISYRNMIVTDVINERKVRVLCANPQKSKQEIVEMDYVIVSENEQYRVKYTERVGARGLEKLRMEAGEYNQLSAKKAPCENVLMLATVGEASNIQLDPHIHKILQCRKEDSKRPISMSKKLQRASIEAGARVTVHVAFKFGSRIALQSTRIGSIIGFGPGINLLVEAPFFTRRLYKLNRQRKFDQISEEDYKRGVIQQSFTSANTVIGATAGAILGQVAIPIPVLGAAVGGALGTIGGNGIGRLEGWAASKLVQDSKVPTLPVVVILNYSDLPDDL